LLDLTGIAASLWLARLAAGFCWPEDGCSPPERAAPFVVIAGLYGAGITVGVVQTNRCSRARARHAAAQRGP
jgi:hypothetical protein